MSKREKQFYCKVGQAVCNLFCVIMFFAVPILACELAGFIASII